MDNKWKIKEGLLYRHRNGGNERLYVPESLRKKVIGFYHDSDFNMHAGRDSTLQDIKARYYWKYEKLASKRRSSAGILNRSKWEYIAHHHAVLLHAREPGHQRLPLLQSACKTIEYSETRMSMKYSEFSQYSRVL